MSVFKAAAIFSDHMVIQMGKQVKVWGNDYSGKKITAEFCGYSSETVPAGMKTVLFVKLNQFFASHAGSE